ncbi:hypothetical protein EIP86_008980 [Pleurotus ostreatoroseus]|nr:hypothetical protein EIP86_008980 [Pleurotus ostreatoroseus]
MKITEEPTNTNGKAAPQAQAVAAGPSDSSPRFVGKFDLYSTKLPFLTKHYLPHGATRPQFEAVYREILTWQAKPDFSVRIALREDTPDATAGQNGMFSCSEVYNPLDEEEITPIHIVHGTATTVSFSSKETLHRSMVGMAPGYIARLELNGDECDLCECGIIDTGAGSLKMRKVWEGMSPTGEKQELFEGYFFFKTVNGPILVRKGWGFALPYSSGFWAVRALKDGDGNEIGIDAGDGTYKASGIRPVEDDGRFYADDDDEEDDEDEDEDEDEDDRILRAIYMATKLF